MLNRQVTNDEATAKAAELNILFMETSAKAGHNVKSLFKKIAMSLPGMEKEGGGSSDANTSAYFISPKFPMKLIISRSYLRY